MNLSFSHFFPHSLYKFNSDKELVEAIEKLHLFFIGKNKKGRSYTEDLKLVLLLGSL